MVSTNKKRLQSDGHFYVLRRKSLIQLVGEAGIEPTTPGLEGRCSIRLSYSPKRAYATTRLASLYCSVPRFALKNIELSTSITFLLFAIVGSRVRFSVQSDAYSKREIPRLPEDPY